MGIQEEFGGTLDHFADGRVNVEATQQCDDRDAELVKAMYGTLSPVGTDALIAYIQERCQLAQYDFTLRNARDILLGLPDDDDARMAVNTAYEALEESAPTDQEYAQIIVDAERNLLSSGIIKHTILELRRLQSRKVLELIQQWVETSEELGNTRFRREDGVVEEHDMLPIEHLVAGVGVDVPRTFTDPEETVEQNENDLVVDLFMDQLVRRLHMQFSEEHGYLEALEEQAE